MNPDSTQILSLLVSLVAAIATVAAAWIAHKTLKVQITPDVIAYLKPHIQSFNSLLLIIENIGSAPAYDIQLSCQGIPISEPYVNDHIKQLSEHGIAMLAPGQKRDIYLGTFRELIPLWSMEEFSIRLSYAKKPNHPHTFSCSFPLELHSFMGHVDISTTSQEDRDRRQALKQIPNIATSLKRIAMHFDEK